MTKTLIKQMIRTARPYPAYLGRGLLQDCGNIIMECRRIVGDGEQPCRVMLVSDDVVAPLYGEQVESSLLAAGFAVERFTFPHGEASKTPETLLALLHAMAAAGLGREALALALGGGVTGDLTGLAASLYLRGISYVQVPTTVLAAVDSSVGGKTGVDLPEGKNLLGSFWQPLAVICDCDVFATLPREIFSEGLAEAVKCAILGDAELFEGLEAFTTGQDVTDLVARCIQIKEAHVVEDETDRGKRRFLNLGHTAAHAMEVCSGYSLRHGRAVAMGLVIMARAAESRGLAREPFAHRLEALLQRLGLPTETVFSPKQLAEAALRDKKRQGDRLTLILPLAIGECCLQTIEIKDLEGIFRAGMAGE